ncbi:MAG: Maf family nucleotide pyrophosphatase [Pseudomonadota bacterium]
MSELWRGKAPLVLASKSAARRALLAAAGLPFEVSAADIDERAVEMPLRAEGAAPEAIAAHLARAKALAVSGEKPKRLVIGADQVLALKGEIFSKPQTLAAAKAQLQNFSGKTHALHSALCVARDANVLFETVATARLTCRDLSADFIDRYLAAAGDAVLASVGAYQLEGLGIHLFEAIDGDQATILGLPLLALLAFLRQEGSLAG